jgi:hypothetical protein
MSFFGQPDAVLLSDAQLEAALATGRSIAPQGCRVEVRALDRSYLELLMPVAGQPPQITREDSDKLPPRISGGVLTVWMDEAIDNVERATHETAKALHDALRAIATVTFDGRRHLDLVGDGPAPGLQAVVVLERRRELDRDSFIQHYRVDHVPLAKQLEPKFVRYTTFRVLEIIGDFPGDCITLQEFPSLDAIREHMSVRATVGDVASEDISKIARRTAYYIGERSFGAGTGN